MKHKLTTAAIALAAFAAPTASLADDDLKYSDLVHCAATSLVVAQVLDSSDGKNQVTIDKMNNQAAALMTFASLLSKKDTDAVFADTNQEKSAVIAILGDDSKSSDFIKTEVPKCKTLGEVALEVIEKKGGK